MLITAHCHSLNKHLLIFYYNQGTFFRLLTSYYLSSTLLQACQEMRGYTYIYSMNLKEWRIWKEIIGRWWNRKAHKSISQQSHLHSRFNVTLRELWKPLKAFSLWKKAWMVTCGQFISAIITVFSTAPHSQAPSRQLYTCSCSTLHTAWRIQGNKQRLWL